MIQPAFTQPEAQVRPIGRHSNIHARTHQTLQGVFFVFVWFYWTEVLSLRPIRPAEGRFQPRDIKNPLLMQERWLSVQEIAAHLGVNRDTVYKWIERKKMPAHKVGRLWKFLGSEVDLWVKHGSAGDNEK